MGVRLGAMGTPWGRIGVPRGEEGGGTRHPRETQRRRNEKTHELDERGEGTTHDHRSTAAFESRRKSIAKQLSFLVFLRKTPEVDESDEGTTHDLRSLAAKVRRQKEDNKWVGLRR